MPMTWIEPRELRDYSPYQPANRLVLNWRKLAVWTVCVIIGWLAVVGLMTVCCWIF